MTSSPARYHCAMDAPLASEDFISFHLILYTIEFEVDHQRRTIQRV